MSTSSLSRRTLFAALSGGTAASVAGCSPVATSPEPHPECLTRDQFTGHDELRSVPLVYEENNKHEVFWFDESFYGQLGTWFDDWRTETKARPTAVRTYGAWVSGGDNCGKSWHHSGRAFDIAGINQGKTVLASCRYDKWRTFSTTARADHARRYWKLAASLHLHFQYVLTYLFDDLHRNHIHVDNAISGTAMSQFNPDSRVQNQAVASICSILWRINCPVSGTWDDAAKAASGEVLRRIGRLGTLTDGENWAAFLSASMRR